MAFAIRRTNLTDSQTVTKLLEQSYSVLLRSAYGPDTLAKALPLITKANPDLLTSGSYYVAETKDGQIIGAGGWTKQSPTGQCETALNGNIRHFGTAPDHVGRGVGKTLMNRCIADASSAGLEELNCYSTLNGEAFYAACGFRTVEPYDIQLPGNVVFPSVLMTRALIVPGPP